VTATLGRPTDASTPPGGGPRRSRSSSFRLVTATVGVIVSVLALYPLLRLLARLATDDGGLPGAVGGALEQPGIGVVVRDTVILVVLCTGLAVVVGSVFAWVNERTDASMGTVSELLPVLPLLLPPIAGAIGWVMLASPTAGFLNVWARDLLSSAGVEIDEGPLDIFTWPGLIFVYTLYLVPHVYLTVAAGLRNVDPALEEAARVSGSRVGRTLRQVTLPAVTPAIGTGALLAGLMAVAMFAVPAILGIQAGVEVLPVRVMRLMTFGYPPEINTAVVLGVVPLLLLGVGWLLHRRILRRNRFATIGGKGVRHTRVRLGRWRTPIRVAMIAYLLATTALPMAALAIVSLQPFWTARIRFDVLGFDAYQAIFADTPLLRTAMQNSFGLAIVGAVVAMALAALIAFHLQTGRSGALSTAVDVSTKVPGTLSHIVVGIAFVAAFVGPPFGLAGTTLLLFLAYLVLYLPQATFSATSALTQVGGQLLEASRVSGARPGRTFRTVALPLMAPGMVAGWTLVLVLIAGDITASAMLAGSRNPVVGFVILDLWNAGTFPAMAAMALIISLVSSAVVLSTLWWSIRRGRSRS
jgi:iron(III) transport system permease protein